MPICFSRQDCRHKKAFEGTLRLATDTKIGLEEGCGPYLCDCPCLEFVEGQIQQRAV